MQDITIGMIIGTISLLAGGISSWGVIYKSFKSMFDNKIRDLVKDELKPVMDKLDLTTKSQLIDMRNDLANKFFVYDAMEEVEDYLVIGFREKCEDYFQAGGDTYIHPMYDKSFTWKIKPTQYTK